MGYVKTEKHIIVLPDNVHRIIGILETRGFEAYAVGGCVRDSLLGRMPEDWDITTSALPEEVKRCFRRTVDTGIAHGTVTVLLGGDSYEVTTYRIDGAYRDHRHPDRVTFSGLLEEDLKRRDFTINAMAYNSRRGLVDINGGIKDLEEHVIRCVGNPDERFGEDALRMLRAVRFAAQLDFRIDENTSRALSRHAAELSAVSRERILTELTKLICSAHIELIREIFTLGLSGYIAEHFDELNIVQLFELKFGADRGEDNFTETKNTYYNSNVEYGSNAKYTIRGGSAFDLSLPAAADQRYIRFAFLGEGMEPGHFKAMLKGLKADNNTVSRAAALVLRLKDPLPSERYALKEYISRMERGLFEDLLGIKAASRHTGLYRELSGNEDLDAVISLYGDITAAGEPIYLKDLAVTGGDLIRLGIAEGPQIGRMLKAMQDHVLRYPEHNNISFLTGEFLGKC